jgi:hypothetical protein
MTDMTGMTGMTMIYENKFSVLILPDPVAFYSKHYCTLKTLMKALTEEVYNYYRNPSDLKIEVAECAIKLMHCGDTIDVTDLFNAVQIIYGINGKTRIPCPQITDLIRDTAKMIG